MSIIITILIFSVIVIIHEFGHFFVAKRCNVLVEEFAIGMGPKICGKKIGETEYTLRALPLGGFCRMADEIEGSSNRIGFNDANVVQRILICFAGPFMNFILAFAIMIVLSMTLGIRTNDVLSVYDDSPAYNAGLQKGDRIISINGHNIHTNTELEFYKSDIGVKPVTLGIKRNGEKIQKTLTPALDSESGRYIMGVSVEYKAPLINALNMNYGEASKASIVYYITDGYWNGVALVKLTAIGFERLITAKIGVNELSGPIGVTTVVDDQYQQSVKMGLTGVILTMINLVALLSINLGVLNLLPIPAIDGGKILIYIIELLTGYKLPKEKEAYISLIGFVLVMGLGVYVAFNDILKLL